MRSLALLVASDPKDMDLQRLVLFDHIVVHTSDLSGPQSLHPSVPMRSGEMLVRRRIIERGLNLMMSRGLILRVPGAEGICYRAAEFGETFLSSLTAHYTTMLTERAKWVVGRFQHLSDEDIRHEMGAVFERWREEFQLPEAAIGSAT